MTAGVEEILTRLGPKSTATCTKDFSRRGLEVVVPELTTEPHGDLAEQQVAVEPGRPDHSTALLSRYHGLVDLMPDLFIDDVPNVEHFSCEAIAFDGVDVGLPGRATEWHARNLLAHCDFRSVSLPEYTSALDSVRATQSHWLVALGRMADHANHGDDVEDDDGLLDITYAETAYTPRRWSVGVNNVPATVDPKATRAVRVYTDADAEGWVR